MMGAKIILIACNLICQSHGNNIQIGIN